jgi:hypothetical protein
VRKAGKNSYLIPFIIWKPDDRRLKFLYKKGGEPLFIPSLMLGPFEQLSVLMLTHLLFAPLGDVTHTLLLYDDIS